MDERARKYQRVAAFWVGLAGDVVIFVMAEFYNRPVSDALVGMCTTLLTFGIVGGALSERKSDPPPPPPESKPAA